MQVKLTEVYESMQLNNKTLGTEKYGQGSRKQPPSKIHHSEDGESLQLEPIPCKHIKRHMNT